MDKGLVLWFGSIVLQYFSEIAILHTYPSTDGVSAWITHIYFWLSAIQST